MALLPVFYGHLPHLGALHHTKFICSPGPEALHEIHTGEQDMEPVHVLGDTAIYNLGITELPFDNQKRMFHFASDGRLPVFNLFVPVESCIAGRYPETGGSDIRPEFDVPEVLIVFDLRPLFGSAVS